MLTDSKDDYPSDAKQDQIDSDKDGNGDVDDLQVSGKGSPIIINPVSNSSTGTNPRISQ